jgi:hypothetical protein
MYPELPSVANLGGGPGGPEQCLGRHAADVEAIAAQEVALDKGDLGAQPGGPGGRDQPGRAGADHDQVVPRGWPRVDPVRRVDVGLEHGVMPVSGEQFYGHGPSST